MPIHTRSNSQNSKLKIKAVRLRKLGFSYALINSKIRVANSTLNYWLKDVPYKPNKTVLKRIQESSFKSAKILRDRKLASIKLSKELADKEIGSITKRDLWMLGVGIYIGEGTKNKTQMVRIVNSDPEVIKLAIKWLKSTCELSTSNFRIAIHTYPDIDIESTLDYWSQKTGIPRNQFRKTQIDTRTNKLAKNKGKSLFGTAQLTVHSNGRKEHGVLLFRKIMGWIEAVENKINAGIV